MPINSFLYPGAKVVPPFTVANSLRLDGSSSNLSRTKGTSDSTKIGTYSWWIKNSKFSGQNLINCGDAFANSSAVYISSSNTLTVFSRISNSNVLVLETDREFRDPSAWHNIVVAIDTTQGTASNRVKVYVDGVQQTSFSTETYPDQNADLRFFTSSETEKISSSTFESSGYFGGYMCEVVKVDGQALAPTSFGQFNEDTPTVWEPIDVSGLTFGTNGYYLDFEDSSNLGNNVSGGTDFTENNIAATDQSTDTCTNNFATLNPLVVIGNTGQTYEEGNLTFGASGNNWTHTNSTIGASQGKWYAEFRIDTLQSSTGYGNLGITSIENITNGPWLSTEANSAGVGLDHRTGQSDIRSAASVVTSNMGDFSNGDIVGLAVDMDNKALYIHKAGTYYQISSVTGVPTSGSSKTGAVTIPAGIETFVFAIGGYSTDFKGTFNFGSPPHSISSGNADANGFGNFEYAVPSGYFALCTKNLAEFG